jgi:helix-turn-helix protein
VSCAGPTRSSRARRLASRRSSTADRRDIAYIDHHKGRYGVEPICRVLPIAPSTYHQHTKGPRSARAVRDAQLKVEIRRIHDDNFGVYGARKLWRQLHRDGTRWPAAQWSD